MRYFAVFALLPYCGMAQSQSAVQGTAIRLKRTIEINHIAPRPVDDRFSSDLFRQFFEAADPDHVFFTQADMASFEKFRTTLDDELQQKGWSFLNTVYPVLKKGCCRPIRRCWVPCKSRLILVQRNRCRPTSANRAQQMRRASANGGSCC